MSISAYKRTQKTSESPRDIERQIFSRVTLALAGYGQAYDDAADAAAQLAVLSGPLQQALAENIRLWAVLRADLAREGNQLPAPLRAQLISLALFVDRQTSAVLRGEGKVGDLVTLNRSIIEGLAGLAPAPVAA